MDVRPVRSQEVMDAAGTSGGPPSAQVQPPVVGRFAPPAGVCVCGQQIPHMYI